MPHCTTPVVYMYTFKALHCLSKYFSTREMLPTFWLQELILDRKNLSWYYFRRKIVFCYVFWVTNYQRLHESHEFKSSERCAIVNVTKPGMYFTFYRVFVIVYPSTFDDPVHDGGDVFSNSARVFGSLQGDWGRALESFHLRQFQKPSPFLRD